MPYSFQCHHAKLMWESAKKAKLLQTITLDVAIMNSILSNNSQCIIDIHEYSTSMITLARLHLTDKGFTVLLDMHNMKLVISGWTPRENLSLNTRSPAGERRSVEIGESERSEPPIDKAPTSLSFAVKGER